MFNFNSAGYSGSCYNPLQLRANAAQMAAIIPKMMEETGAEFVVVTGKSGLSVAYATLMLIDFPLVVVRKDGENSHGSAIEGDDRTTFYGNKYLILDDFVASGRTVQTIHHKMEMYQRYNNEDAPLRCVAVLEYGRSMANEVTRTKPGDHYVPVVPCGAAADPRGVDLPPSAAVIRLTRYLRAVQRSQHVIY